MPTRPPSPCRYPSCPALVLNGGYCEQHKQHRPSVVADRVRRQGNDKYAMAAKIRSSSRWTRLAKQHKAIEPMCRDVFKVHGKWPPATQGSHHIIPIHERPDLAFDITNLGAVCNACHERIERMEREGTSTRELFSKPTNL